MQVEKEEEKEVEKEQSNEEEDSEEEKQNEGGKQKKEKMTGSKESTERLVKELQLIKEMGEKEGFSAEPIDRNLFKW